MFLVYLRVFSESDPFMDHSTTASLFVGREDGEEQLVPSGINKTYHCQRCLNHGRVVPRKGHKRCCMYADCSCYNCSLVEERKLLNRAINNVTEKASNWINVEDSEEFNEFQNSKSKILRKVNILAHKFRLHI